MLEQDVILLLHTFTDLKDEHAKRLVGRALRSLVNRLTGVRPRKQVDLTSEEIAALRDGKKLECVKLVKERLGFGILEAKRHVEEFITTCRLQFVALKSKRRSI